MFSVQVAESGELFFPVWYENYDLNNETGILEASACRGISGLILLFGYTFLFHLNIVAGDTHTTIPAFLPSALHSADVS